MASLSGSSLARWAAYLAVLAGLVLIFRGVDLTLTQRPPNLPYALALIIIGALEMGLSYRVLAAHRASWAFLTSLNGTLFVVGLFGAPKLRDALDVHIGLALLPCLAFGAICLLTALAHDDFDA